MNRSSLQFPAVNFVEMFSHCKETIKIWKSFAVKTFQYVQSSYQFSKVIHFEQANNFLPNDECLYDYCT